MRLTSRLLVTVGLTVLAGCHFNTDSSTATQGATAAANKGTGSASLIWEMPTENTNGSPLTDLAGYTIVYGQSPETMNMRVQVPDIGTTSYVVTELGAGTWYFAIVSYTSAGTNSALSNIAVKDIS